MRRRAVLAGTGCLFASAGCLRLNQDGNSTPQQQTTGAQPTGSRTNGSDRTAGPDTTSTTEPTETTTETRSESDWEQTYGSNGNDVFFELLPVAEDRFVLVGSTESGGGGRNGWLLEIDETGEPIAQETYGSVGDDSLFRVIQTADGGYLAAGLSDPDQNDQPAGWLVKTDDRGGLEWQQSYEDSTTSLSSVVDAGEDGYVAAGETDRGDSLNGILINVDESGAFQGEQLLDGTNGDDFLAKTIATDDDRFVAAGRQAASGGSGSDGWMLGFGSDGSVLREETYGGREEDGFEDVIQTDDGGFLALGWTRSNGRGGSDGWFLKTDASGGTQWERFYGGDNDDRLLWITRETEGYLASGETNSASEGDRDGWILRTDRTGQYEADAVRGSQANETLWAAHGRSDGSYLAAGESEQTENPGVNGWAVYTSDLDEYDGLGAGTGGGGS